MLKKIFTALAAFSLFALPVADAQVTTNLFTLKSGKYTMTIPSYTEICNSDQTACSTLGGSVTTEVDPVAGAVNGIVMADGAGNISAATAGTDYQTPLVAGTDYLAPSGDGASLTNVVHTSGDETVGGKKTLTDDLVLDGGTYSTTISAGTPTADVTYTLPADDGSLGQVLTTDGSGGLTWESVTGSATPFDCTVGATGADYTTIGAAIAGSCNSILAKASTTETGNITVSNKIVIYIKSGVTLDFGAYNMSWSANNIPITVIGEDWTSELQHTSGGLFSRSSSYDDGVNIFENVYFDNNATSNYYSTIQGGDFIVRDCYAELPNYNYSLFDILANQIGIIEDSKIRGGGTSCTLGDNTDHFLYLNNVYLSNTFSTLTVSRIAQANNVYSEGNFGGTAFGNLTNIRATGGEIRALSGMQLSNSNYAGSVKCIYGNGCNISNSAIGTIDLSNASYGKSTIIGNSITNALTIAGNNNVINGNYFVAGVTVSSGATGNIITSNQYDTALSDSGTGTVAANNYEY